MWRPRSETAYVVNCAHEKHAGANGEPFDAIGVLSTIWRATLAQILTLQGGSAMTVLNAIYRLPSLRAR